LEAYLNGVSEEALNEMTQSAEEKIRKKIKENLDGTINSIKW
jgi:hypothetical protein